MERKSSSKNTCNTAKNNYLNLLLHSITIIFILKRKKQSRDYSFSLGACFSVLTPFLHPLSYWQVAQAQSKEWNSLFLPMSVAWSWSQEALIIWDKSSAASVGKENSTGCTVCREELKPWYSCGQEEKEGILHTPPTHMDSHELEDHVGTEFGTFPN